MKQEHIIFLVLVVAAAVVLGTTFGIINGYTNIIVEQKLNQPKTQEHKEDLPIVEQKSGTAGTVYKPATSKPKTETAKPSEETSKPVETHSRSTVPEGGTAVHGIASDGADYVLSSSEAAEVHQMLVKLGYSNASLTEAIRSFQQQNGMPATGKLDEPTLDTIVQRTTLLKARAK
ncbi:MAG: peptidoglycan-binding domain-containing protein [Solirubrobacterales bacterium]